MNTNFYQDITFLHADFGQINSDSIEREPRDHYCMQYNHAGRIQVQVGKSAPITVVGPSLFFTFPGQKFKFGTKGNDTWHHNYLAFNGERIQRYLDADMISKKDSIYNIRDSEHFLRSFKTCVKAIQYGIAKHSIAVNALDGMLLQLQAERELAIGEPQQNIHIKNLIKQIQNSPENNWDFQKEATMMHTSYGHFRRCFKNITKESPRQFVLNARLNKAANMLTRNDSEIKTIADAVGIPDIHYFTKLFHRRYHIPPGKFRKELQST